MRKIKLIILFVLFTSSLNFSQSSEIGEAKGVFLSSAVGPRFPLGDFGKQQAIGVGFDIIFSYADNVTLPIFLFAKVGYQNYPGEYEYYKITDHSSLSTNIISFSTGAKHYFTPIIEDIVLLMPILEGGVTFAYLSKFHQYKIDSNRSDSKENLTKMGFYVGGGFTIFLMDLVGSYNYLNDHQYVSFDIRLTIPLAVSL